MTQLNLREKTINCTQYYKNQNEEHIRTQIRLIVTIYGENSNVSPREVGSSLVKVSYVVSFTTAYNKFEMENNSKTVTGAVREGVGWWRLNKMEDQSIFILFLQSFVKSRPIETRTHERQGGSAVIKK